jgi:O-acetyl-ADP-ribose deacetylase (regulator of RNase III)
MKVEVVQGSLTDGDESVLVNASNTGARLGSGVSHAIRVACGPEFQGHIYAELERLKGGPMEPGDLFVTHAGAHPNAKHVVHAAVMDYREGAKFSSVAPDEARIRAICDKLWPAIEAIEGGPHSVAMVALGGGTGGLGVRMPTEVACETLKAHGGAGISRVRFYGWADHEFLNMADVVSKHFDGVELSDEVREQMTALFG